MEEQPTTSDLFLTRRAVRSDWLKGGVQFNLYLFDDRFLTDNVVQTRWFDIIDFVVHLEEFFWGCFHHSGTTSLTFPRRFRFPDFVLKP